MKGDKGQATGALFGSRINCKGWRTAREKGSPIVFGERNVSDAGNCFGRDVEEERHRRLAVSIYGGFCLLEARLELG